MLFFAPKKDSSAVVIYSELHPILPHKAVADVNFASLFNTGSITVFVAMYCVVGHKIQKECLATTKSSLLVLIRVHMKAPLSNYF